MCRLLQRFLPALTGYDAALRVKIEEDIVPAVRSKPLLDSNGPIVIAAGMADENGAHDPTSL